MLPGPLVQPEVRVPLVPTVRPEVQAARDLPELTDLPVPPEQPDQSDHRVRPEAQALPDLRELTVPLVLPDRPGQQE